MRDRFYGDVELRRPMGRDETFYCIDKARELLGFAPQYSWRDVLPDPRVEYISDRLRRVRVGGFSGK